jgi:hypothetical protein
MKLMGFEKPVKPTKKIEDFAIFELPLIHSLMCIKELG